jgi:hypothetical protein
MTHTIYEIAYRPINNSYGTLSNMIFTFSMKVKGIIKSPVYGHIEIRLKSMTMGKYIFYEIYLLLLA